MLDCVDPVPTGKLGNCSRDADTTARSMDSEKKLSFLTETFISHIIWREPPSLRFKLTLCLDEFPTPSNDTEGVLKVVKPTMSTMATARTTKTTKMQLAMQHGHLLVR